MAIMLFLSHPCRSQDSDGYWGLHDVRLMKKEAVYNEKTEGPKAIFSTVIQGKVDIRKSMPHINNGQPNFHAQLTWENPPEVLLPGDRKSVV